MSVTSSVMLIGFVRAAVLDQHCVPPLLGGRPVFHEPDALAGAHNSESVALVPCE